RKVAPSESRSVWPLGNKDTDGSQIGGGKFPTCRGTTASGKLAATGIGFLGQRVAMDLLRTISRVGAGVTCIGLSPLLFLQNAGVGLSACVAGFLFLQLSKDTPRRDRTACANATRRSGNQRGRFLPEDVPFRLAPGIDIEE